MVSQVSLFSLLLLPALISAASVGTLDAAEENAASEKVSVKINELFDSMLPEIKNIIVKNGLDPLRLNDMTEHLPGILIKNRYIKLTNGWCQGLVDIKRAKDVLVSYQNKILTMDAILNFDVLGFTYEYLFDDALITRRGDLQGTFTDMEMRLVLALDMVNYKLELYSLQIDSIRKLEIKLVGHKLDPILNAAIRTLTNVFHKKVLGMVEELTTDIMENIVRRLNRKIPRPDDSYDISDVFEYFQNLPETSAVF